MKMDRTPKSGTSKKLHEHLRVRQEILDLIVREGLEIGCKIPSEIGLAARLGVSRMTANKSIQGLVQDGWLRREKGSGTYVLRIPGSSGLETVFLFIKESEDDGLANYYFSVLLATLQGCLRTKAVSVQLGAMDTTWRRAEARRTAYVAISPSELQLEDLAQLADAGERVCILGSTWPRLRDRCIDSDNVLGALMATNHLLDFGHREILFLGAYPEDSNTRDRMKGYELALKGRGLSLDPGRICVFAQDILAKSEDEQRLKQILFGSNRPTAVFAAGPKLAMRVLALARDTGTEVPRSLSIVAYDDPEFFELAVPPLTTIRQPLVKMAAVACERLISGESGYRSLDPEIVLRNSVAAPVR